MGRVKTRERNPRQSGGRETQKRVVHDVRLRRQQGRLHRTRASSAFARECCRLCRRYRRVTTARVRRRRERNVVYRRHGLLDGARAPDFRVDPWPVYAEMITRPTDSGPHNENNRQRSIYRSVYASFPSLVICVRVFFVI